MLVEIFSKTNCPYCTRAEGLARSKNFEYKKYMLDEDFTREELFEQFPGARTFPQIRIDGEIVGGYNDFETWVLKNGNN